MFFLNSASARAPRMGVERAWKRLTSGGGGLYQGRVIIVSALRHIERLVAERTFTRSLSLLAPWQTVIFDDGILPRDRLILAFNDITAPQPGCVVPDEALVGAIVDFGRACRADDHVLAHCWMGVSRSPAAAYIIACARAPGEEKAIADALRRRAPTATPNRLLVSLADELLARGGKMVDAIDAIGRGCEFDGDAPPFALPLDWSADADEMI
ncbi:Predicted protein tyrosine phosphatase [Rhodoblastus acidophilus]|uniref:Protein tyrosine phosphatase n=1 Tax=Rhodoblastus acidophilus TaxID=1074 RepID=A0A212PZV2_RHOAC|nr:hypothetical protein CKO16_17250 [Rhodoblastus acidophilus]RAI17105.1 hypothetical protein CH337_17935 [Rhodoblastus acidophilus]SNB52494.1 Predicted protein tyrosine phosphatase [Rhodoblastus acidophilus]